MIIAITKKTIYIIYLQPKDETYDSINSKNII